MKRAIKAIAAAFAAAAIIVPIASAFQQPQPPPTFVWNGVGNHPHYVSRPTTMRFGPFVPIYIRWGDWGWSGIIGTGLVLPNTWYRVGIELESSIPCYGGGTTTPLTVSRACYLTGQVLVPPHRYVPSRLRPDWHHYMFRVLAC